MKNELKNLNKLFQEMDSLEDEEYENIQEQVLKLIFKEEIGSRYTIRHGALIDHNGRDFLYVNVNRDFVEFEYLSEDGYLEITNDKLNEDSYFIIENVYWDEDFIRHLKYVIKNFDAYYHSMDFFGYEN